MSWKISGTIPPRRVLKIDVVFITISLKDKGHRPLNVSFNSCSRDWASGFSNPVRRPSDNRRDRPATTPGLSDKGRAADLLIPYFV